MPARKLAGAAMAAASNSRLMVIPPSNDVSPTTVVGPDWAASDWTASSESTGVGTIGGAGAELPVSRATGEMKFSKFGSSQAGPNEPPDWACWSGTNFDFIA